MESLRTIPVSLVLLLLVLSTAGAQDFGSLKWRNIGPNRGGRSQAIAGSLARPLEYYFGATGGGLWKTTDSGTTWKPVTDGQIHSSSVGAVAVAPSNPDVVYIGMGETELRASILEGDGVYKSVGAGKTWRHMGLEKTQAISRIRINPQDPNIVYVAALGPPYGPGEERGVFRSRDGGVTWQRVLFRGNSTGVAGAIDLDMDPHDPNVLYASRWDVCRKPWMLSSGGPLSGLFKSTDGGTTWSDLTRAPGMPAGTLGKICVSVSGADSKRIYAMVEADEGGLFRSDDAGATWARVNEDRKLRQRAFYFSRIYADPGERDAVYVLNVEFYRSADGGKTFRTLQTPHSDHHDLWIASDNPKRIAAADDGGGSVSVNQGETWTRQEYPTAQFYHVTTTKDVPYHVCGAQQDDGTACVLSSTGLSSRESEGASREVMYVSLDDGANWRSLSLNLPDTPVVDLVVEGDDLVIATHGRSFWILDNIGILREWNATISTAPIHLFTSQGGVRALRTAAIDFHLSNAAESGSLEILASDGEVLKRYSCALAGAKPAADTMPCRAGTNRVTWNLTYPGPTTFPGLILRYASPNAGPPAPPGTYRVRLTIGANSEIQPLVVHRDPRVANVTDADLRRQFELALQIRNRLSQANEMVIRIRRIRDRIVEAEKAGPLPEADNMIAKLTAIEESLYQVRNRSARDALNYPIKLNNQLAVLQRGVSMGDYPPTDQDRAVLDELAVVLNGLRDSFATLIGSDLNRLNDELKKRGLQPISGF